MDPEPLTPPPINEIIEFDATVSVTGPIDADWSHMSLVKYLRMGFDTLHNPVLLNRSPSGVPLVMQRSYLVTVNFCNMVEDPFTENLKALVKAMYEASVFTVIQNMLCCTMTHVGADKCSGTRWMRVSCRKVTNQNGLWECEYVVQDVFYASPSFLKSQITIHDMLLNMVAHEKWPQATIDIHHLTASVLGEMSGLGNVMQERIDATHPTNYDTIDSSEAMLLALLSRDTHQRSAKRFLNDSASNIEFSGKFAPHAWLTDPYRQNWTQTVRVAAEVVMRNTVTVIGAPSEVVQWKRDNFRCATCEEEFLDAVDSFPNDSFPEGDDSVIVVLQSAMEHPDLLTRAHTRLPVAKFVFVPTSPVSKLPRGSMVAIAHAIGVPTPLPTASDKIVRTSLLVHCTALPHNCLKHETTCMMAMTIFEDWIHSWDTPFHHAESRWRETLDMFVEDRVAAYAEISTPYVLIEDPYTQPLTTTEVVRAPRDPLHESVYATFKAYTNLSLGTYAFYANPRDDIERGLSIQNYAGTDAHFLQWVDHYTTPQQYCPIPRLTYWLKPKPSNPFGVPIIENAPPIEAKCDICLTAEADMGLSCCKGKAICTQCSYRCFSPTPAAGCPFCRQSPVLSRAKPEAPGSIDFQTSDRKQAMEHALKQCPMTNTVVISNCAELLDQLVLDQLAGGGGLPVRTRSIPEFFQDPNHKMLFMQYKHVSNMDFTGLTVVLCDPWPKEPRYWLKCDRIIIALHTSPFMLYAWETFCERRLVLCTTTNTLVQSAD